MQSARSVMSSLFTKKTPLVPSTALSAIARLSPAALTTTTTAVTSLQPVASIHTSAALARPDAFQYDNQTFYPGINFGHKRAQTNIRNRNRHRQLFRKQLGLQKMTRVRIVDNSKWATLVTQRNKIIIQVYKRNGMGNVGDLCLITVGGHMKRALIVGQRTITGFNRLRSDTNNVIIVDDGGSPEGTRITVPIPAWLRNHRPPGRRPVDMSKVIAIATKLI